jgi:hypothetical protein
MISTSLLLSSPSKADLWGNVRLSQKGQNQPCEASSPLYKMKLYNRALPKKVRGKTMQVGLST